MATEDRIPVGIMYPAEWEARPREQLDADLARVLAVDPRLDIVDVRYVDPDPLRTRRGADPAADLRAEAPELTAAQRDALARVEIVIAQDLPFDVRDHAPHLRWVQGMGAGVSQLQSAGLNASGIALTSAAGVNAVSISEFVLARLLQIWKLLPEIDQAQADQHWNPVYGKEIAGSTLGVVGLGAIGREVARRGRALGMTVVATRRTARPGDVDPDVDQLLPSDRLPELLAQCDAVVAAVPEGPDTVDLFDRDAFAAMTPGSVFCNVGRGSAVVEDDLADALRSGHLRAAAIDVVRDEPLAAGHPLWETPNLLISPHSASSADRFWSNLYLLFEDNLRRYLAGESLRNVVDDSAGWATAGGPPR